jgi:FixJ family two-component response regulator
MAKKEILENKTIIILEDKPDRALAELENLLRKEEAMTLSFQDTKEFLDYVRIDKGHYDVALIDLELKDEYAKQNSIGGKEVIGVLKRIHRTRPIICRSGYGSARHIPYSGADRAIIKDKISAERILEFIEEFISKYPVER